MSKNTSKASPLPQVAFLRDSINVGGNKKVKMEDLKKVFEALGFGGVKTLLASGNVVFVAPAEASASLSKKIEQALEDAFGIKIGVVLRTISDIQSLVDANPFKGVKVTPATRLYVTFLPRRPRPPSNCPTPPRTAISGSARCGLGPVQRAHGLGRQGHGGPDEGPEKEFGKAITTRNWNTVEKVLKNAPAA